VLNYFAKQVDVAVKVEEPEFVGQSTIIDMTTDEFKILREGAGIDKLKEYMYTIEE